MFGTGTQLRVPCTRQHSQKYKSQEELKLQVVGTWVICEALSDFSHHPGQKIVASCSSTQATGIAFPPSLPCGRETALHSSQERPAGLKVLTIQGTNSSCMFCSLFYRPRGTIVSSAPLHQKKKSLNSFHKKRSMRTKKERTPPSNVLLELLLLQVAIQQK